METRTRVKVHFTSYTMGITNPRSFWQSLIMEDCQSLPLGVLVGLRLKSWKIWTKIHVNFSLDISIFYRLNFYHRRIILTMRLGWILWMLSFYPHKSFTNSCQTSFQTHVRIFPLPEFYSFPVNYQVYLFSLQTRLQWSNFSAVTFLFEDFKQLYEWTCFLSNQKWECWVFETTENSLNGIYLGECVVWKVSIHSTMNSVTILTNFIFL